MDRRHLFEFTDLGACPDVVRTLLTDFLHTILERSQPFTPKLELIVKALQTSGTRRILDLCSGGSGPWLHLKGQIEAELGAPIEVLLTDKFPNERAAARLAGLPGLSYHPEPVDATQVPQELDGVRTIIDGLHHFPPQLAEGILADAVRLNQPIIVFEALQRTWRDLLQVVFLPLFILILTPFVKPFKISRLLLTYVLPVALIVIPWDVIVSVLRCYRPQELLKMGEKVGSGRFDWQAGAYRHQGAPVTYLVGLPKTQ